MWKSCLNFLSISFASELETFVEDLKKDSAASSKTVTLKDVEDGAFLLRQVGEAVATLKGMYFPFYFCFFSFNRREQFCLWSGGINFYFQKDLKLGLGSSLHGPWRQIDIQVIDIHPIVCYCPGLL